ncbi:MAG: oligosaccharide flippase family protein [Methylococcaceae bacterium]|jgi:O-antigen/teichoic acid export membrane protein
MLGFLARGALGSLIIKLAIVGLAFLNQLVVTRLMGAERFGVYVNALTWLTVLATVARMGTDSMLTRFVAAYVVEAKWALLKGLIRFGYAVVLVVSVVLIMLGALLLDGYQSKIGQDVFLTWAGALLLLPVTSLVVVGQSLLYGFKQPWRAQLSEALLRIAMMTAVCIVYWQSRELSASAGMFCGLVSAAAVLAIVIGWVYAAIPDDARGHSSTVTVRSWLSVCLPLGGMGLIQLLMSQGSLLLVGLLQSDPRSVGIYAVALRVAELAAFGLQAVNLNLAPVISELYVTRRKERLQEVLTHAAYGIFGFTAVVAVVLYSLGDRVLLLFGPDFSAAYYPMLILVAGQMVNALTGSVGLLLTMTGHQVFLARMVTVSVSITLSLAGFMVPQYGAVGAASANAMGLVILNLANLVYVARRLGLNPTVFDGRVLKRG